MKVDEVVRHVDQVIFNLNDNVTCFDTCTLIDSMQNEGDDTVASLSSTAYMGTKRKRLSVDYYSLTNPIVTNGVTHDIDVPSQWAAGTMEQVNRNPPMKKAKRKRLLVDCDSPVPLSPPPIGLERQYHELLHLLRRGLLGNSSKQEAEAELQKSISAEMSTQTTTTTPFHKTTRNASALLMGPRGHGKTLLLEQCLRQLEYEATRECRFRVVRLNGLLLRGEDVGVAVREITRQIGHMAWEESVSRRLQQQQQQNQHKQEQQQQTVTRQPSSASTICSPKAALAPSSSSSMEILDSFKDILQREASVLRMRNTSFHSMLAFLDETLQLAKVDSIPILIVLDELDAFLASSSMTTSAISRNTPNRSTSSSSTSVASSTFITTTTPSNRQLLLYHLLDRVTDYASLISFVGITTRLSTVGMFEKRVKSRAEGTSKVIYVGHVPTYETWIQALLSKVYSMDDCAKTQKKRRNTITTAITQEQEQEMLDEDAIPDTTTTTTTTTNLPIPFLVQLKNQLQAMLSSSSLYDKKDTSCSNSKLLVDIRRILHRNYQLGKDLRWLSRILSVALSLAVGDFITSSSMGNAYEYPETSSIVPFTITPHHILQGIMTMGGCSCSYWTDLDEKDDEKDEDEGLGTSSGPTSYMTLSYDTPRTQGLLDLSGSQLAVLLSAKRILSRDVQGNNMTPITYERLYNEYIVSFIQRGKSSGSDHYDEPLFYKAFIELSQVGLIAPASDHGGGGPLQYNFDQTRSLETIDMLVVKRLPLHINVDVHMELGMALKKGHLVGCTTALREWGNKTN